MIHSLYVCKPPLNHSTLHISLLVLKHLESMHDESSFAALIYPQCLAAGMMPGGFFRLFTAESKAVFPRPDAKLHERVY